MKEEEMIFDYKLTLEDILKIVGDWFSAKRIHYVDEMFEDYFEHVKDGCMKTSGMQEYISDKSSEIIWIWLSIYHRKKRGSYKEVKEEKEELIPEWFLKGRYDELENLLKSKYFSYSYDKYDIEYDSFLREFSVTLRLKKEMDEIAFKVLISDVKAYLDNHLTLLSCKEGKIIESKIIEFCFKINW
ncbi:MAG: hypothetical protein V3V41_04440 [Candidatus Heimdallarchaeota archaeon]